ncbi:glutamic acid-rich protein isoform X2 [Procambarus clarkii]|uniref:glutamic acid-rich protein isoform X2 n=1 Tax=Procambarus clarkii TaxID=6728 RepID=UPI001E677A2C|nr:uncharacterized protein LOC123761767 isoform X3 [Procambarus clarkii]
MDENKKKEKKSERYYNEFSDENKFNTEVEHVESRLKKKKKKDKILKDNLVNKKKKKKSKRYSDEFSAEQQCNAQVEYGVGRSKKKKKKYEVNPANKEMNEYNNCNSNGCIMKLKTSEKVSQLQQNDLMLDSNISDSIYDGTKLKKRKIQISSHSDTKGHNDDLDIENYLLMSKCKKRKLTPCLSTSNAPSESEVEHVESKLKKKKKKKKFLEDNLVNKKKKKKSKRYSDEFSAEQQCNAQVEYGVGRSKKKKKKKFEENPANKEMNEYNNCNSNGCIMKLKTSEKVSQLQQNDLMLDSNISDSIYDGTKLKKRKVQISSHSDTQRHNDDLDIENYLLMSKCKKLKLTPCLSTSNDSSESSSKEVINIKNISESYSARKSKKSKKDDPSGETDLRESTCDRTIKEKKRKNRQNPDPGTERKLTACDVSNNNFSGEGNIDELTSFMQGDISESINCNFRSNMSFAARDQENNSSHSDGNAAKLFGNVISMPVDDFDYDDDDYAEPKHLKKRIKKTKPIEDVELEDDDLEESEEDDCTDFTVTSLYNTSSYNNQECEAPECGMQREIKYKSFDELLYKIPPGEGIPLEDSEEVPDEKCYWKKHNERMIDNFTEEEIEQEVMNKIYFIHDYFKRFETGKLTEEELKEVRPRNFHEPYFPTPKHMEFFKNLDIKITWPLNKLHEFCQNCVSKKYNIHGMARKMGFTVSTHSSTHEEDKKLLRNWIKFQKEYGFYDLRPLTSVRTTRVIIDDEGNISFRGFRYISLKNQKKLGLYLAQGLPNRTPAFALKKLRFWAMNLEDNIVKKKKSSFPGRYVAKMVYMLKRFGANFSAVELVVGKYIEHYFRIFFDVHVRMQNLKFRSGAWLDTETERLKRGIVEVMKVKSWRDAEKKRIKWLKLIPYVRTRNSNYMRERFLWICRTGYETTKMERYWFWAKLIHVIYDSGVDHLSLVDWDAIAEQFPDGIIYLYDKFLPYLRKVLEIAGKPYNLDGSSQCSSEGEGKDAADKECDIDDMTSKCAEEEMVDNPDSVGLGCHHSGVKQVEKSS